MMIIVEPKLGGVVSRVRTSDARITLKVDCQFGRAKEAQKVFFSRLIGLISSDLLHNGHYEAKTLRSTGSRIEVARRKGFVHCPGWVCLRGGICLSLCLAHLRQGQRTTGFCVLEIRNKKGIMGPWRKKYSSLYCFECYDNVEEFPLFSEVTKSYCG